MILILRSLYRVKPRWEHPTSELMVTRDLEKAA
jgi:hypothetical protein